VMCLAIRRHRPGSPAGRPSGATLRTCRASAGHGIHRHLHEYLWTGPPRSMRDFEVPCRGATASAAAAPL